SLVRLVDLPPAAAPADGGGAAPHTIYNIGNHTPIALKRFIGVLEAALGREASKRYLPMQPGEGLATYADAGRLARVTGFPPLTPLGEGIARFVAWYRAYHGG